MELDPKSLLRQLSDVGLGVAKSFESERAVGFVKALISSMDKTVKAIDKYLNKGKDILEKGYEVAKDKGANLSNLAKGKLAEVKDKGLLATAKKTAQDTTGKFKDMFASDTEKANGPPQGVMGFIKGVMPVRGTKEERQFAKDRAAEMIQEHADKTGKPLSFTDALTMIKKLKAEQKARRAALENPARLDAVIDKVENPVSPDAVIDKVENPVSPEAEQTKLEPEAQSDKKSSAYKSITGRVKDLLSTQKKLSSTTDTPLPKSRMETILDELGMSTKDFEAMLMEQASNPSPGLLEYLKKYLYGFDPEPTREEAEKLIAPKMREYLLDQLEEMLAKKNNSLSGKLKPAIDVLASKVLKGSKSNSLMTGIKRFFKGKEKDKDAKDADVTENDKDKKKGEDSKKERKNKFLDSFKKQKDRMTSRQKEVEDEKSGAKTKNKVKGKGPLGMIISAIGSLGSIFAGGIGKLLFFLPKIMVKGMTGALTTLVPSLAKFIAPGAASLIGSVAGGAAKLAGVTALKGLGGAAVAVGSAILSPIGVGVIAVGIAAFSGYKLYKYLNRNNIGSGVSGKLTKLRMLSYGYNDVVKEHYNKVLDMDMLVKDYVSGKDGMATYKPFDSKFKKAILEIFSIARTDKDKYELLNIWFVKRYVPAHAAFMNAYYSAGGKVYIDDLDKLNPEQSFKFISNYRLQPEVFDQKSVPIFEAPDTTVSKADVDAFIVEVINEAKEGFKNDKDKKAGAAVKNTTKQQENKAYTKAGVEASDRKFTKPKELTDVVKDASDAADLPDKKFLTPKEPVVKTEGLADPSDRKFTKPKEGLTGNEEGEKPPPASSEKAAVEEKPLQSTVDKVAKAPGPLKTDNDALVGIKSKVATEKIQNLDPNVLTLLSGMTKEYSELTGKSITVNEAFRTREDQVALKASKGAAAAAPGTSLHEFGIAVDISSADADTLDKMGLMRKYGFTRPIGGETWHIEPAGVSLNPGGSKADPQERAKNILSSPGRGGGGLGANRGLPSSMKYKRDITLQKKLFNEGSSVETAVERPDLKEDTSVASGPVIDNNPVKPPVAGIVKTSATATDPTKILLPKQEGLDAPKVSKPPEGPQLTKASYRPQVQDKKIYSDYSEAEKPPKEDASKIADNNNANLSPKEAILKASQVVGVDYNKLLTFAKMESSLNANVKAGTSSATGLFQIVGNTWRDLLKRFGPKYNIPPDAQPNNAYYNSVLGACYAKENMAKMEKFEDSGIRHDGLIYLAHHFGPSGGTRIARAYMKNPDAPIQTAVSDDAYKANIQELGNKTVRQYIDFLTAKFNKAGSTEYADKTKTADKKVAVKPVDPYVEKSSDVKNEQTMTDDTETIRRSSSRTKDANKVYGDNYDYNTGQDQTPAAILTEKMASKANYPITVDRQVIQKPRPDFGGSRNIPRANPAFNGINETIGEVSGVVGGINGVFNNISKGIADTTSILNKGMNPGSIGNATRQIVLQQPSAVMSLDKTESLLMSVDNTLIQIKVILQSINDKGAMMPTQAQVATVQAKETPQSKEPIIAPNYNPPSTQGVSMSRRSVLM